MILLVRKIDNFFSCAMLLPCDSQLSLYHGLLTTRSFRVSRGTVAGQAVCSSLTATMKNFVRISSRYWINRKGQVWTELHQRLMTTQVNKFGYSYVVMCVNRKVRCPYIHRLMAQAFLPPKPYWASCIRHLDGKRSNNVVSNLKWGTPKQNAKDRDLHGKTALGENNGNSKLTALNVTNIKKGLRDGLTLCSLAKTYGVTSSTIHQIKNQITWRHIF